MSKYFLKPYESSDGNIKVELDLSNYAMKHRVTRKRSKKILNQTENRRTVKRCLLTLDMNVIYVISQRRAFYRPRIPESSRARKKNCYH